MAVSTVKLNGTTLMTVNDTTAEDSDVAVGKEFYGADGVKAVGTRSAQFVSKVAFSYNGNFSNPVITQQAQDVTLLLTNLDALPEFDFFTIASISLGAYNSSSTGVYLAGVDFEPDLSSVKIKTSKVGSSNVTIYGTNINLFLYKF